MFRPLCMVLLVAVGPHCLFAQDGADPAVRMAGLREALDRAKTLRITFASEIDSDKGKDTVKGTMIVGEGNKARVELKMSVADKSVDLVMISDGKTTQTISGDNKPRMKPTEVHMRKNLLAMIERAGVAVPMFTIRAGKDDEAARDLTKSLTVSDLKHKESDKGEKGVYKCTYKVNVEGRVIFLVELWTDLTTNLPLRRTLETEKGANEVTVRETYTVEANPMLKEDIFELRKAE